MRQRGITDIAARTFGLARAPIAPDRSNPSDFFQASASCYLSNIDRSNMPPSAQIGSAEHDEQTPLLQNGKDGKTGHYNLAGLSQTTFWILVNDPVRVSKASQLNAFISACRCG